MPAARAGPGQFRVVGLRAQRSKLDDGCDAQASIGTQGEFGEQGLDAVPRLPGPAARPDGAPHEAPAAVVGVAVGRVVVPFVSWPRCPPDPILHSVFLSRSPAGSAANEPLNDLACVLGITGTSRQYLQVATACYWRPGTRIGCQRERVECQPARQPASIAEFCPCAPGSSFGHGAGLIDIRPHPCHRQSAGSHQSHEAQQA